MTSHSEPETPAVDRRAVHRGRIQMVALVFVTIWFFVGGLFHLFLTDLYTAITPDWAPYPRQIVLVTGVLEIIAAAALWHPRLRWPTGIVLMIFTVCVTPVHIDMLKEADRYGSLGQQALWGRLLFQPVLVGIIYFATRLHRSHRAPKNA